ncbi:complex I subunit 5 family protein [Halomicrococcus gelatinilyticus]|uniref:complex I subunit 5 family protein n=1 Tax=Halomicrococcus gelatinilyticus TaxID=1702103 RepID=UPI002E128B4B
MTDAVSPLPLVAVLLPTVAVPLVYATRSRPNVREGVTLLAAVGTLVAVWLATRSPATPVTPLGSVAGVPFDLRADAAGLLFALLASTLWLVTSVYSIGYVRTVEERSQTSYFAAFAASIAATMGVAFAANLFTLFVFYELLTLATYPLVVHAGTAKARRAGRTYVAYTLGGGVLVLGGIVLVGVLTGTVAFVPGGIAGLATVDPTLGRLAFALLVVGFGVKTAIMPLHRWLPAAMVAPTPVSGLLHAVAVVKSGVFAVARTVLYTFGPDPTWDLGVGLPLAVAAAVTMVLAGVVGLRQDNLKRGLAYSTVSQLSYIALGVALATPLTVFGAFLHVVAHAFMKITLFFAAGVVYAETGEKYVSDIAGIGRRLPMTMAAFAVAAAGLVGFPLVAGFVSKFQLVLGAAGGPVPVFVAAYLLAGVLKLLYFWPVVYVAFFGERNADDPESRHAFAPPHAADGPRADIDGPRADTGGPRAADGGREEGWERRPLGREATPFLLVPVLVTVGFAVALGVAPTAFPVWELAETVVAEVFG